MQPDLVFVGIGVTLLSGNSFRLLGLLMLFVWLPVGAEPAASEPELPHEILEQLTDDLVVEIVEAQGYFEDDPERFYQRVDVLLTPVVDFTSFSRAIMGRYGSSKYYKSLATDEERKAYRDQVRRFAAAVKDRMVVTFSKGIMTFSNERIEVVPADPAALERIRGLKSVVVTQLIYRSAETPMRVEYKLKPNRNGDWKLVNVVIDNVNLGKQYRSEFTSKLKEFDGDIDRVIEYWENS